MFFYTNLILGFCECEFYQFFYFLFFINDWSVCIGGRLMGFDCVCEGEKISVWNWLHLFIDDFDFLYMHAVLPLLLLERICNTQQLEMIRVFFF